ITQFVLQHDLFLLLSIQVEEGAISFHSLFVAACVSACVLSVGVQQHRSCLTACMVLQAPLCLYEIPK
uniref:Uncharacterized protein n=1 Tax=Xiphophorus couchianus TaxID=32473 RepID=A0A3B5LMJ9_9TELE